MKYEAHPEASPLVLETAEFVRSYLASCPRKTQPHRIRTGRRCLWVNYEDGSDIYFQGQDWAQMVTLMIAPFKGVTPQEALAYGQQVVDIVKLARTLEEWLEDKNNAAPSQVDAARKGA